MALQVYGATHDGQGNSLPRAEKQFISFSYGGKNIENFDLLAVFASDRLTKSIYEDFTDTTTQITGYDGQIYWLTQSNGLSIHFDLATDGMTSANYELFKKWFSPGIERELILAEFPNRAIKARVASAPQISLLPFEDIVEVKIGGTAHRYSASLYKGDISLDLICDSPFWYAVEDYFSVDTKLTGDVLKAVGEDGIPCEAMLSGSDTIMLAGNKYYDGTEVKENSGISVSAGTPVYIYNCGNAPSRPIISFSLSASKDANGYINLPGNSFVQEKTSSITYNDTNMFSFSTPLSLTSYNQAISIVKGYSEGASALEIRGKMRDELNDYYARAYAVGIVDTLRKDSTYCDISAGAIKSSFITQFVEEMSNFLPSGTTFNYSFNTKTGSATMKTQYSNSDGEVEENVGNMIKTHFLFFDEQKLPNENGEITKEQCSKLVSSCSLSNFKVEYQYMYR